MALKGMTLFEDLFRRTTHWHVHVDVTTGISSRSFFCDYVAADVPFLERVQNGHETHLKEMRLEEIHVDDFAVAMQEMLLEASRRSYLTEK